MLPRLIDDKRRRRRWLAFISFTVLTVATGAIWLSVRNINERWRDEGLSLLREFQAHSSWLVDEMDLSRDAVCILPRLEVLLQQLATQTNISLSDVDFALHTRKAECQSEAQVVARQCVTSIGELAELRLRLAALQTDGTNVMRRLEDLEFSDAANDIDEARKSCLGRYGELQALCARQIVLSWNIAPLLAEHRKFADYVSSKKQVGSDWSRIEQAHLSYVAWSKDLESARTSYVQTSEYVRERFVILQQFPFDRDNTVELTRKNMEQEVRRVEPLLFSGADLLNSSSRRVDEALVQYQTSARAACESLVGLQKMHGDFVDKACVTSVVQLVNSFAKLRRTTRESISRHIETIQADLDSVTVIRKQVGQTLLSLGDDGVADERIAKICATGLGQVRILSEASGGLASSLGALSNYVAEVQGEAKDKSDEVVEVLKKTERSLPDWRVEGDKIIKEIDALRHDIAIVRTSADDLNKTFVYYRDNKNHSTMSLMHTRIAKIFEMLKKLEASCTGAFPCSNGIELLALMQRRDKVKKLVELIRQEVQNLPQELEQLLVNGTLRKIKFVEEAETFASQLQNGVSNFAFALNIPNGGRHQIELRFTKGGRSLYKMSPPGRHSVVMKCIVSGALDKEAELSWADMTSSWSDGVTFDGDFDVGINAFCLDISFQAVDFRGRPMSGGTWQYQYGRGSLTLDNLIVEFWIDGIKQNVLWGVPAQ